MAFEADWTKGGLAVGKLTVYGTDLPGCWVIVNREFRAVPE
jgi:hypothetical protein